MFEDDARNAGERIRGLDGPARFEEALPRLLDCL
jgi:hypothetical protein